MQNERDADGQEGSGTPNYGDKLRAEKERETLQLPIDWLHVTSRGAAETIRTDTKTSAPTVPSFEPQHSLTATTVPRSAPPPFSMALKYRLRGTRQGLPRITNAAEISQFQQR